MEITEDVSLEVDGIRLKGFQEINITRSMKDATIAFALRATNPAWSADAFSVRFAKNAKVKASSDLMVTGPVDDYESDQDGGSDKREVRISGKSKGVLATRHPPAKHKTGRIENKTLLDAAKEFDEFGVGFSADVKLQTIEMIQRHPADTVFDTIERYARPQGLMLMGQPDGGIKLTRGGTKRHAGELREGVSRIKKIKVKISQKNKASVNVVRNQRRVGVAAKDLRSEEQVYDPSLGEYRPAIIFGETDQDKTSAKNRGEWQRLRQGSFGGLSVSATVAGWRDDDGLLWEPGRLMFIVVPSEKVEQDMQLESVTYTQNFDGTVAELSFVVPETTGSKASKAAASKNKSDARYQVAAPDWTLDQGV